MLHFCRWVECTAGNNVALANDEVDGYREKMHSAICGDDKRGSMLLTMMIVVAAVVVVAVMWW